MKVFSSINDYNYEGKSYLTIGTFDGVHLGHQEIIKNLVSEAHSQNNLAIVLTFFPHPRNVINRSRSVKLIDSISEKEKKLKFLGVDVLIIHPFNRKFSDLSANQYVKSVLIEKLKISKIFVGYDHRFGKNRSATVSDLIKYGIKYNFKVTVIEAKEIDEISVSSTKIRNALSEGNINLVNKFLGHDYQIEGEVIHDQGLGSKIGFPTANIKLNTKKEKKVWGMGYPAGSFASTQVFFQSFINRETIFYLFGMNFNCSEKVLSQHEITNLTCTPTFLSMLLIHLKSIQPSVKKITTGGEKITENLIQLSKNKFINKNINSGGNNQ